MLNHPILQYLAAQIPNNLVDVDDGATSLIVLDMGWIDTWIDDRPLSFPVSANVLMSVYPPALHAVRPVHIRMHSGEDRINVTSVE